MNSQKLLSMSGN